LIESARIIQVFGASSNNFVDVREGSS